MPSFPRQDGIMAVPIDKSTNAPSILAVNGVFCFFALVVVLARLYVRAFILKHFGIDDYLIMTAMAFGIAVFVCFIGETNHGVGMHLTSITPTEMVKLLHWQTFHSIAVTIAICLVKLSVGFFLLYLVPGKAYKIFLWCMIAFLIAFTFTSAGTILFSCIPIRASWDRANEPNAVCFSPHIFTAIGLFNSSINIFTDIIFATLPIPLILTLQVNMRTKLTLLCILSLGYFACVASIVKTVYQTKVLSDPDSIRNDSYFVWNSVELYVGILAASLPALRPLFKKLLATSRSLRSKTRGATYQEGYASSGLGGTRHKYYIQDDAAGLDRPSKVRTKTRGSMAGETRKYDVKVTTRSNNGRKSGSGRDFLGMKSMGSRENGNDILGMESMEFRDSGSIGSEHELSRQATGITKTIDISIV